MAEIRRFVPSDLGGVIRLSSDEGWPSLRDDPDRALRVLTAPGVTTVVAVDNGVVIGYAQMFSDGELQAFLAGLAVAADSRRAGIGRQLITDALRLAGGERVDLLSEDDAADFYRAFPHFQKPGFRLYPFYQGEA